MATITLGGAANWSTCNSGSPPAAGDSVNLGNYVLTLDAATCTCVSIYTAGSGYLLPSICTALNADLSAGTHVLLETTTQSVTITGTVTPGTGAAHGAYHHGSGTCRITDVTAGVSTTSYGLYLGYGVAYVTNVTGGSTYKAYAVYMTGASSHLHAVNITGGSATSTYGLFMTSSSYLTATNVVGGSGIISYGIYVNSHQGFAVTNLTGGSGRQAHGCWFSSGSNVAATITTATGGTGDSAVGIAMNYNVVNTTTIGTSVASAKNGGILNWSSNNIVIINGTDNTLGNPLGTGTYRIADGNKIKMQDADGNDKFFYGDSEMPAVIDVRKGIAYGVTDFTGTFSPFQPIGCGFIRGAL